MARGANPGERRGGRVKGTPNKRTEDREHAMADAAEQIGAALGDNAFAGDAHALLMGIYKDTSRPIELRLDAAKAAIGYEKPKLTSIDAILDGNIGTYTAFTAQPIPVEERDPLASANGSKVGGDQKTPD